MEKTTPKQLEILLLLYRFRFLNRIQIQQLLNHKDPRRINTWLKDLTERNITGRKYSKKLLDNTKPAIYCLSTKSRKILLDEPSVQNELLKRVYRDKTRSNRLINHCVLLANIYLYLFSQIKDQKLHFFTKTDLSSHYYLPYNHPDAYIAVELKDETKRYFLEIIDEGIPRFMLRSKISQYIEYFEENTWQEETGHSFPSILLLCPDENIKTFLHKHIVQVLEEESEAEIDFYLTTKEILGSNQPENDIWEKAEEEY
ncbi:MAG: replication-relaxation family protein [Parcubacteria group bacterium]|nr:replication-relaxation family protein [Parcubacteria group bacterium]